MRVAADPTKLQTLLVVVVALCLALRCAVRAQCEGPGSIVYDAPPYDDTFAIIGSPASQGLCEINSTRNWVAVDLRVPAGSQPLVAWSRGAIVAVSVFACDVVSFITTVNPQLGRPTFWKGGSDWSAVQVDTTSAVGTTTAAAIRTEGKPYTDYNNSVCDCDCGVFDVDCLRDPASRDCPSGSICDSAGHCTAVAWAGALCPLTSYWAYDECNCECPGTVDPDCYNKYSSSVCSGSYAHAKCNLSSGDENATAANMYPPRLVVDTDTGFKSIDALTFKVRIGDIVGRSYTEFHVGRNNASACNLSVIGGPSSSPVACYSDVILGTFVWNADNLAACGLSVSTGGTLRTYSGSIVVKYEQTIVNVSGTADGGDFTRTGSQDVPFTVQLEDRVVVSPPTVVVYDPVNAHPVVTNLDIRVVPDGPSNAISLTLVVGVQKPFHISAFQNVSNWNPSLGTFAFASESDAAFTATHTWKDFVFTSVPAAGVTSYDEVSLEATLGLECLGIDAGACPIRAGVSDTIRIRFQFSTGSFVGQLVDSVVVNATMTTYSDDSFSSPSVGFFIGSTVYAKVAFSATKVSLTGATLNGVWFNGVVLTTTNDMGFYSGVAQFSALLDKALIDDGVDETAMTHPLVVQYTATYTGTRRDTTAPKSQNVLLMAMVTVDKARQSAAAHLSPWF
eukprot:m51a1_g12359 hypothetical protein (676) ;mRNA; r:564616-569120